MSGVVGRVEHADANRGAVAVDLLLRRHSGEAVRWLRARLGLRRSAFALALAVSPDSVRAWERGSRPPARLARARLARMLAPELVTPAGATFIRTLVHVEQAEDEEGSAGTAT